MRATATSRTSFAVSGFSQRARRSRKGSGDRFLNRLYTIKKWHVQQESIQIAEYITPTVHQMNSSPTRSINIIKTETNQGPVRVPRGAHLYIKGWLPFHIRCSRNCQWDERRSLGVGVQALASNPLQAAAVGNVAMVSVAERYVLLNWTQVNVFVKPDEQWWACSVIAMARKRRMKSNVFVKPNGQSKFTCILPWREKVYEMTHSMSSSVEVSVMGMERRGRRTQAT